MLRRKFTVVFFWNFFFLLYLPDILRYFNKIVQLYISPSLPNVIWICFKYIWLVENNIVFLGRHFPMVDVQGQRDTRFIYQAFFASIILSSVIAVVGVFIDRKHNFLESFRTKTFPVLYVLVARFTALVMIIFGLDKVFTNQFEEVHSPGDLMTPLSAIQPGTLVWAGYGISDTYEIILGLLEVISAILLWIPRAVVPGAVFGAIILINVFLMDIFIGVDLVMIVIMLLGGYLFLLAPEMPHYFHYFLKGRINVHQTPIYSLCQKQNSPQCRIIFHCISLIILLVYTFCIGCKEYELHSDFRSSYADPMYGVWDTQNDITFGKNRLGTLGVDRTNFSQVFIFKPLIYVAVFPVDKSSPPDMEIGKSNKNTIKFSILDNKGKDTEFTLQLEKNNAMSLSYTHNGMPTVLHYHRRIIQLHDFHRSIFDEDHPKTGN